MASTDSVQDTDSANRQKLLLVVTDRDILFHCPACQGELVVDRAGEGMEVTCSHCAHRLVVPPYQSRDTSPQPGTTLRAANQGEQAVAPPPPPRTFDHSGLSAEGLARRLDELKHQLKENRSQDTEMRGHVNRATMELHRLQLRLKKLQERHETIQAEVGAIKTQLEPGLENG